MGKGGNGTMATLEELLADPGPPEDPYCAHCFGFGFAKELDGTKADMGWLYCIHCQGRQRRPANEILLYNELWALRERTTHASPRSRKKAKVDEPTDQ